MSSRRRPTDGGIDLSALAEAVAPLVAARLAASLAGAAETTTYTTRPSGPRPPEYADRHRTWRTLVPMIPGAVRLGRWWAVTAAAYRAWLVAQAAPSSAAPAPAPVAAWSPARLADDLGIRLVGGGR